MNKSLNALVTVYFHLGLYFRTSEQHKELM